MPTSPKPTGTGDQPANETADEQPVLADTSGLYALLDADDLWHEPAAAAWIRLIESERTIVLHHFVLLEVWSLLQAQLGLEAVGVFHRDYWPLCAVVPVTEHLVARGAARCIGAARRDLSLTDCVSFELGAEQGIASAFAFYRHFREAGFILPDDPGWLS
jgi:predicted nucleic acid-binding protein